MTLLIPYSCANKGCPVGFEIRIEIRQPVFQVPEFRCARCDHFPVMVRGEITKENGSLIVKPTLRPPADLRRV